MIEGVAPGSSCRPAAHPEGQRPALPSDGRRPRSVSSDEEYVVVCLKWKIEYSTTNAPLGVVSSARWRGTYPTRLRTSVGRCSRTSATWTSRYRDGASGAVRRGLHAVDSGKPAGRGTLSRRWSTGIRLVGCMSGRCSNSRMMSARAYARRAKRQPYVERDALPAEVMTNLGVMERCLCRTRDLARRAASVRLARPVRCPTQVIHEELFCSSPPATKVRCCGRRPLACRSDVEQGRIANGTDPTRKGGITSTATWSYDSEPAISVCCPALSWTPAGMG